MSYISIQLPPGLERQNGPYDSTDRWWDMNLTRWQSGTMIPVGGWQRLTGSALTGTVRKIFSYRDNSDNKITLIGTDSKLYSNVSSSSTYSDITPSGWATLTSAGLGGYGTLLYGAGTYGTPRATTVITSAPFAFWSMSSWGQDVIVSSAPDGRVFYFTSATPTVAPAVITNAPTETHGSLVTAQRHVMVFGCTISGTHYSRRVAWCSREDTTDWDFASVTNSAGFQDLDTQTPLLRGVTVREGTLIFSYGDVFLATYVGTPFIHSFTPLSTTAMFHPYSVATFNGRAAWVDRAGFRLYDGGTITNLPCPILNDILRAMDPVWGQFRIFGCNNGLFSEIWWFYPSAGQTECDRYVFWNYAENYWGWGGLARSAMCEGDVFKLPIMGNSVGNVFEHESGYTDSGNSLIGQRWAETGALGLGDGDRMMHVRRGLLTAGTNYSALTTTLYGRNAPDAAETVFGPYSPRSDGWTDLRALAREHRIRFTATRDEYWGVGKQRFDVAEGPRQ